MRRSHPQIGTAPCRRTAERATVGGWTPSVPDSTSAATVTVVGGLPVTSVARTIADLGRMLPFEAALVPADGALFRRLVTPDAVVLAECAASSQSRLSLRGVHGLCEDDGAPQEARGAPRYVPKYQRLPSGSRIPKSRDP